MRDDLTESEKAELEQYMALRDILEGKTKGYRFLGVSLFKRRLRNRSDLQLLERLNRALPSEQEIPLAEAVPVIAARPVDEAKEERYAAPSAPPIADDVPSAPPIEDNAPSAPPIEDNVPSASAPPKGIPLATAIPELHAVTPLSEQAKLEQCRQAIVNFKANIYADESMYQEVIDKTKLRHVDTDSGFGAVDKKYYKELANNEMKDNYNPLSRKLTAEDMMPKKKVFCNDGSVAAQFLRLDDDTCNAYKNLQSGGEHKGPRL